MNREQGAAKAEDYIKSSGNELTLVYDEIMEFEYGFCFIWNSKKYLSSRKIEDMFIGPSAFIVPKNGDDIYCLGSAYSQESLILEYTNHHEEKYGTYGLWVKGKLSNTSIIRQKYSISVLELKKAIKGTSPLIKGSKQRLTSELQYLSGLDNVLELTKI